MKTLKQYITEDGKMVGTPEVNSVEDGNIGVHNISNQKLLSRQSGRVTSSANTERRRVKNWKLKRNEKIHWIEFTGSVGPCHIIYSCFRRREATCYCGRSYDFTAADGSSCLGLGWSRRNCDGRGKLGPKNHDNYWRQRKMESFPEDSVTWRPSQPQDQWPKKNNSQFTKEETCLLMLFRY